MDLAMHSPIQRCTPRWRLPPSIIFAAMDTWWIYKATRLLSWKYHQLRVLNTIIAAFHQPKAFSGKLQLSAPLLKSFHGKVMGEDVELNPSSSPGIHLPLHHPRSPCSPAPLPPIPFSTVLLNDDRRVHSLASRINQAKSNKKSSSVDPSSSSISVPLTPGTSLGVGNYVTKINLGTPSAPYAMVVDTGSSLTWLQCYPCKVSCHDQAGPIFDPSASATYSTVPCSAPDCRSLASATLNPSSCTADNVCLYEASYGDSSFSIGYLSRDTLRVGSLVVPGFVYGCGQDNEGLFGKAAGLIGLAKNHISFLSQSAAKAGAYAFSYCLPTMSGTGSLTIGPFNSNKFAFTPMLSNSLDNSLYFIGLSEIRVGDKAIPVSSSSYKSPTIIDSGTVISRLPSDVHAALSKAVAGALKGYKRAEAYSILDTCFAGSVNRIKTVPAVSLVFAGGAEMKLPAKNVLIDVDRGRTCLAFAPATRIAILGNRQQQTFDVVYDIANSKIGFAAGGCG